MLLVPVVEKVESSLSLSLPESEDVLILLDAMEINEVAGSEYEVLFVL